MVCVLEKEEGVRPWINSKLKPEQIKMLKTTLLENTPDQLGLNFSLWTRQAIQNLIINFWDISVSLVTVGRHMKELGFTLQKPIKRAYCARSKSCGKMTILCTD